ncbi:MAG: hypothetical protein AAGD10_08265 [Myxococcota bacterium]
MPAKPNPPPEIRTYPVGTVIVGVDADDRLCLDVLYGSTDTTGRVRDPAAEGSRLVDSAPGLLLVLKAMGELPEPHVEVMVDGQKGSPVRTVGVPLVAVAQQVWDQVPQRGVRFTYSTSPSRTVEDAKWFEKSVMPKLYPERHRAVEEQRAEAKRRERAADDMVEKSRLQWEADERKRKELEELNALRREKAVIPAGLTTKAVIG